MQIKKQDIFSLNLGELVNLSDAELVAELSTLELKPHASWILPQLVAWFGSWSLADTGRDTVIQNCDTPHKRTLYRLTRIPRSALVGTQTRDPHYGSLTPLIMMGFKRMCNRDYESWRAYAGLEWIMEPQLYKTWVAPDPKLWQILDEITPERLLQIRTQGLTGRTGRVAGVVKPAASTWKLNRLADTELATWPSLAQTVITQCWLAHPQHRTPYMILDPRNWDYVPHPLAEAEVVTQPSPAVPEPAKLELPWL